MFVSRHKSIHKLRLVFACMMAAVQQVGAQEYFHSASDFARLYVGAVEPQYQKSLWHDIPYYKDNTDMYKGRISYHGVVYDDVQLRFDQLKQCVVVLPPGEKVICMPEQEFVDWLRWTVTDMSTNSRPAVAYPMAFLRMAHDMRHCSVTAAPTALVFIIVCGRFLTEKALSEEGNI